MAAEALSFPALQLAVSPPSPAFCTLATPAFKKNLQLITLLPALGPLLTLCPLGECSLTLLYSLHSINSLFFHLYLHKNVWMLILNKIL